MIAIKTGTAIRSVTVYPFEVELDKVYRGEISKIVNAQGKNEYEVQVKEFIDDMSDKVDVMVSEITQSQRQSIMFAEATVSRYLEKNGINDGKEDGQ